ncbi:hypothetical protein [Haladaptatus sp. DFWS20]
MNNDQQRNGSVGWEFRRRIQTTGMESTNESADRGPRGTVYARLPRMVV